MNSFKFLDNNKKYEELLDTKDIFLTSDLHFFKNLENEIYDEKYVEEYYKCIKNINKYVKKNDILLILGDLLFKHLDINNINHLNYIKKSIELYKRINCRKILIRGNHDITISDDIFYKMGFEYITNYLIAKNKNIIFTHIPHDVEKDKYFNIHGHIHGSKCYYGMNAANHFDVYYKLWNKPLKISEVLEYYMKGLYTATEDLDKKSDESQFFDKNYNYIRETLRD